MQKQRGVVALPTTMSVGGRTYEILSFAKCKPRFDSIGYANSMSQRSMRWKAHLGQEEGEHLLIHQAEIRPELREYKFIYTAWRRSNSSEDVASIGWEVKHWVLAWTWRDDWDDYDRVLRRESV